MGFRGPVANPNAKGHLAKSERASRHVTPMLERDFLIPSPERKWLKKTKNEYLDFWSSDVSKAVDVADLPAIRRLFSLRDEADRLMRLYQQERMIDSPTRGEIVNPAGKYAEQLFRQINQLEDRFGLNPISRARLGLTIGQESLTFAQLAQMLDGPSHAESDELAAEVLAVLDDD